MINEKDYVKGIVEKSASFISPDDMKKIQASTVAQAGFGGIGAFVTELLARWGIKTFRLLDMDKYEMSNMNRQVFATSKTLGKSKAQVAAERILEINPYANIEQVRCERLTKNNVVDFIKGATVIINGVDFPSGQLPLHYNAKKMKIPLVNPHCMHVTGAAVEVFDYRSPRQQSIDAPTKNDMVNRVLHDRLKLFKFDEESLNDENLAKADKRFMGSRGATLNFVTNMAACIAAAETIKLITGKGVQVLYPKQIFIDPYNLNFKIRSVYGVERVKQYMREKVLKK